MSLFGGKKDDIQAFEDMRRALAPSARANQTAASTPDSPDPSGAARPSGWSAGSPLAPETRPPTTAPTQALQPAPQGTPTPRTPREEGASVISAGTTWQGTLKLEDSLRVEGHVAGEIEARHTVHVAETAHVEAKVRAAFVVIAGRFQGDVHCKERLELLPTSRIKGEITTKSLVIHEGAVLDGQIHMSREEQREHPAGSSKADQSHRPSHSSVKTSEPATSGDFPLPPDSA